MLRSSLYFPTLKALESIGSMPSYDLRNRLKVFSHFENENTFDNEYNKTIDELKREGVIEIKPSSIKIGTISDDLIVLTAKAFKHSSSGL